MKSSEMVPFTNPKKVMFCYIYLIMVMISIHLFPEFEYFILETDIAGAILGLPILYIIGTVFIMIWYYWDKRMYRKLIFIFFFWFFVIPFIVKDFYRY